jgi:hypothetical protein
MERRQLQDDLFSPYWMRGVVECGGTYGGIIEEHLNVIVCVCSFVIEVLSMAD